MKQSDGALTPALSSSLLQSLSDEFDMKYTELENKAQLYAPFVLDSLKQYSPYQELDSLILLSDTANNQTENPKPHIIRMARLTGQKAAMVIDGNIAEKHPTLCKLATTTNSIGDLRHWVPFQLRCMRQMLFLQWFNDQQLDPPLASDIAIVAQVTSDSLGNKQLQVQPASVISNLHSRLTLGDHVDSGKTRYSLQIPIDSLENTDKTIKMQVFNSKTGQNHSYNKHLNYRLK